MGCPLIGTILFGSGMISYLGLLRLLGTNPLNSSSTPKSDYKHPRNQYVISKPMRERFPEDAVGWEEAVFYFRSRATQGLADGVCLLDVTPIEMWGALATFSVEPTDSGAVLNPKVYYSVYIFHSHRGQGHYSRWLKENPDKTILTTTDCKLAPFLASRGRDFTLADPQALEWVEYKLVQQFYGDHCAGRTGLHFMNHVDEGLFVMRSGAVQGCSEAAMRAYVLHPLVQGDDEYASLVARLADTANTESDLVHHVDPLVIALAVEYRHTANRYLSQHHAVHFEAGVGGDGVRLSPCKDVNDMLIADKVQNRKDFDLMHVHTHPKGKLLSSYFDAWLRKLGVSQAEYAEVQHELLRRVFGSSGCPEEQAIAAVDQYSKRVGAQQ